QTPRPPDTTWPVLPTSPPSSLRASSQEPHHTREKHRRRRRAALVDVDAPQRETVIVATHEPGLGGKGEPVAAALHLTRDVLVPVAVRIAEGRHRLANVLRDHVARRLDLDAGLRR